MKSLCWCGSIDNRWPTDSTDPTIFAFAWQRSLLCLKLTTRHSRGTQTHVSLTSKKQTIKQRMFMLAEPPVHHAQWHRRLPQSHHILAILDGQGSILGPLGPIVRLHLATC
jgi:transcriptional regulator of acetoin/glycerol metabolism